MIIKRNYKKNMTLIFLIFILFLLSNNIFAQPKLQDFKVTFSDFDFLNNKLTKLNGKWLFAPNELLTYKNIENINNSLEVPGRFSKKYKDILYGTYAIKIEVKDYQEILGLRIDTISSSYKLFVNSKLILESGTVGKTRDSSKPERVPKLAYFRAPANEFWIIIQVSDFYNYRGGIWYPIEIGSATAISRKEKISTADNLFVFGILIFISIYHLILFLFIPKNKENLSISGFSTAILIRNSLMGERMLLYLFNNINFDFVLKLQTIIIAYALYFYIDFFNKTFPNIIHKKLLKFNKYLTITSTVVGSFIGIKNLIHVLYLLEIISIIEILYLLFTIIISFIKGNKRLIYLLVGVVILTIAVINDILLDNLLISSVYLTSTGLALFMLFNSLLTAKNLADTLNKIEENKVEIEHLNTNLIESNKNLEKKVYERTSQYKELTERYKSLSVIDQLTQIYNRRKLDEVLKKISTSDDCLSIILLDIDKFKLVNDTYGHQIGDSVLIEMSSILKENIRITDTLGRWGGEEFLIICPNTEINDLKILSENLRKKIDEYNFKIAGKITASFGIATSCEGINSIDLVLEEADKALYRAKLSGRNKVCK